MQKDLKLGELASFSGTFVVRVNITFIFNIFYSRCRSCTYFSPLPNTGIFKRRNKIEEHYLPRARATITLLRILNSPIIHESRSRPQSLETRELNRIAQLNLTQSRTKSSPMNCSVPM